MGKTDGVNKLLVSVCAAFIASLFACMFSQPGDMILTETYKKDVVGDRTFVDVVSAIHARGGIGEFFRGTGARIVHVGMIITSQLVIYDIVKQMLGLAATGSH
jgi:solute carrier family 25 phosphate transporter 3